MTARVPTSDLPTPPAGLQAMPGHYIRRVQQMAVAAFMQTTQAQKITPVQFAALQAISDAPGLDQRTLASTIGFDTSTIGDVLDRLESRGLLERSLNPSDRRVRNLNLTAKGRQLLADSIPAVHAAQEIIMAPLSDAERKIFIAMLHRLVHRPFPPSTPT